MLGLKLNHVRKRGHSSSAHMVLTLYDKRVFVFCVEDFNYLQHLSVTKSLEKQIYTCMLLKNQLDKDELHNE